VLLIAFSFIPVASSAPTQNDVAGSWKDSFSDDTGIDLTKSSAINVSGGNVTFDATGWTRDDPWGIETVDSIGDVGDVNSIAVDSNGIPHIVYYDATNGKFKYAYWDGSSWDKQIIPDNCPWPSFSLNGALNPIDIAVDSNDNLHIAYFCSQNSQARYIRWNGTGWDNQAQISDNTTTPSFSISIAVDSADIPHIVYNNKTTDPGRIFYAKGPVWTLESVLSVADRVDSYNVSISTDSSNIPYLIYDDSNGNIKYAIRNGASWNMGTVGTTGLSTAGTNIGVGLNIDSVTGEIRVVSTKWSNFLCLFPFLNCRGNISEFISNDMGISWNDNLIVSGSHDGFTNNTYYTGSYSNSISSKPLGGNDNLQISYVYSDDGEFGGSYTDSLWCAERLSSVGAWDKVEVDSSVKIKNTSIAQDNNNFPHIAYYDVTNNDLRYAGRPLRGTVISEKITPTVLDSWDTFSAVDDTTHGNIVYSILDGNDFSVLKSNVTSGQDISDIDATAHPTIRLKASISATGNPAVSAILQSWGVTWIPDATSPVFGNLEAWDKDDNWIDDTPPNNVVADYLTSPKVTIHSDFNDGLGLGIFDHKIKYTENDWADTITYNCGGVGSCLVDICAYDEDGDGVPEISCPLPAGTEIKYKSEATDNAIPPNPTTYSPEKSFTVIDLSVTLTAAPNPVDVGNNTTLTAAVGGSAMGAITYKFDCGDGGGWGPIVAVNTATCNYAVAGTYTARVEVTRQGIMATNTTSITVNPPNNPPTASITCNPASCQAYIYNSTSMDSCGLELQNASADPEDCLGGYPCVIPPNDKGFSSCLWEIDGGFCPVADCSDCSGINFSLTAGNHTADLTVTDQGGLSSSSSRNITFKKDAYADFECSINGGAWEDCGNLAVNPEVGDTIDFRADDGADGLSTRSDGSGGWNNFDWDFSDGVGTGVVTSHIYNVKGAYTVTLTVTDSAMRHARRSYTINVGTTVPEFPKNWREIAPSK